MSVGSGVSASVRGDLVLALSVMVMRIERRGEPTAAMRTFRLGVPLLCHIVTKRVCLWLRWKAARSWCESFSKVVPLMRFT